MNLNILTNQNLSFNSIPNFSQFQNSQSLSISTPSSMPNPTFPPLNINFSQHSHNSFPQIPNQKAEFDPSTAMNPQVQQQQNNNSLLLPNTNIPNPLVAQHSHLFMPGVQKSQFKNSPLQNQSYLQGISPDAPSAMYSIVCFLEMIF